MNYEQQIQDILVDNFIGSPRMNNEATQALLSLIREAKIEENQRRLDKIIEFENHVPQPGELTTRSFGSASGAMEIEGFKNSFIKRIEELKAEAEL